MRMRAVVAVVVVFLLLGVASGQAASTATSYPLRFSLPTGGTCTVQIKFDPADPLGINACAQQAATAQATGTTVGIAPQESCNTTGTMQTFAGGYGSGLPAKQAPLWEAYYLISDGKGDLYVSDSFDNRIREIDTSGVMHTVAGSGPAYLGGDQGDGGPATCARLNFPMGIARDSAGNLYISDWFDEVIRKVAPDGTITTVAGNGVRGYTGDGGPAADATLASPFGLGVDSKGDLFIADTGNAVVREVTPNGTISTIAGNGISGYSGDGGPATQAELDAPMSVRVGPDGSLYIAEYTNCVIRKVNPSGIISTVVGTGHCGFSGDGGPATQAQLWGPDDLSLDKAGDIYISDLINFRIREVVAATGTIKTVAGTGLQDGFTKTGGLATSTDILGVLGVQADNAGGFWFDDAFDVFHVGPAGIVQRVAGDNLSYSGDGYQAKQAELLQPWGVAARSGKVYIADSAADRIRAVSVSTGLASTVAGRQWQGIPFASFGGDGGVATSAFLNKPQGVAVGPDGSVYIADTGNDVIRKVSPTGTITTVAGVKPTCPAVWACTTHPGFSGDGGPATQAKLNQPGAVAVDAFGNLYIADTGNNRIRKVATNGVISTFAGDGKTVCPTFLGCVAQGDGGPATAATLAAPGGVAVAPGGAVYIGDTADNVVRVVRNGIITTVAGSGVPAYTGDGGAATQAGLDLPSGVTVDSRGNLFIADVANAVIREVTPNGTISTVAGNGPQVYTTHPGTPTPAYFGTYCGDNGPAKATCLAKPTGVAVSDGRLYIADPNNTRVWRVTLP